MGSFACHACAPPGATVSLVCTATGAGGAGSAGPFLLLWDVPFLMVSWGTSMSPDAAELCKAEGSGGRPGSGRVHGAGAGLQAGCGANGSSGGAMGALWESHPNQCLCHSPCALLSASFLAASESPRQQVPSCHRCPGTIYSSALLSTVMLAPHRDQGWLARVEHPAGHGWHGLGITIEHRTWTGHPIGQSTWLSWLVSLWYREHLARPPCPHAAQLAWPQCCYGYSTRP